MSVAPIYPHAPTTILPAQPRRPRRHRPRRPKLTSLLRRQHGIAARQQLFAAGLTAAELLAHFDAGRWRSINEHVVCTHNGPLTRAQQLWAVLLSAAAPAALCGLTVLELYGVRGFETDVVHIVVPRGARVLPVPGVRVKVHESRRFEASDIRSCHGLAVTDLARSTIDAAVWTRDVRTAWRIVVAPVQQRQMSAQALAVALDDAGKVRHRSTLRRLLADLLGGAEALSEVEFLRFCRRHGLPQPRLQVRMDRSGRRRYLDATFVRPDGTTFGVEVDGGVHLSLAVRWLDTAKDNDANLDGELVLRYPSIAIYTDDLVAVGQIRRALGLPPELVSASIGPGQSRR